MSILKELNKKDIFRYISEYDRPLVVSFLISENLNLKSIDHIHLLSRSEHLMQDDIQEEEEDLLIYSLKESEFNPLEQMHQEYVYVYLK